MGVVVHDATAGRGRRMRRAVVVLSTAFVFPACTGGGAKAPPTPGGASALGRCPHVASLSTPWPGEEQPAGLPADRGLEFRGTSTGGQLWALVASFQKLRATIWWATEGVGSLTVVAEDAEGLRVEPKSLDFVQGGVIGWDRPGFQFNSEFEFPHSGCWAMRAFRGPLSGAVWLDLDALARSTVLPSPSGT